MTKKVIINSAAQNINRVSAFYDKIGFKNALNNQIYVTDNQSVIKLNSSNSTRVCIELYTDNSPKIRELLMPSIFEKDSSYVTSDPNGVLIDVFDIADYPNLTFPDNSDTSLLGNYAGIGIETLKMKESVDFYVMLGYNSPGELNGSESYLTLQNDELPPLTLFKMGMCPHSFYNPSLTFFNGKEQNPILIKKMKELGITFTEEVTVFSKDSTQLENVIVEDGGGLHFFVFND